MKFNSYNEISENAKRYQYYWQHRKATAKTHLREDDPTSAPKTRINLSTKNDLEIEAPIPLFYEGQRIRRNY